MLHIPRRIDRHAAADDRLLTPRLLEAALREQLATLAPARLSNYAGALPLLIDDLRTHGGGARIQTVIDKLRG